MRKSSALQNNMPITLQNIDNEYLLIKYAEDISSDVFHKFHEELYSYANSNIAKYQIVDLSDVTELSMTSEDIEAAAFNDIRFFKKLKTIFVAVIAPDDLSFGLTRMWQTYADSPFIETDVFKDIDSAKKWISSKMHA